VHEKAGAGSAESDSKQDEPQAVPPATHSPDKKIEELDVGWGERPVEVDRLSEDDERLLRERPPHWE
jgi:hypothetical protein